MRRNQCIYIASVLFTSIALSSISSTSSSPCLRTATAAGLDDVFGEDLEEGLFDDVLIVEDEDVDDSLENDISRDNNNNNGNNNAASTTNNGSGATMAKNLAESLADLKSLFSTGISVSGACENELIPPEESCCLPPGSSSSASGASSSSKSALGNPASFGFDMVLGGQQQECFAPPIDDQEHPWESSPSLVEAMRGALTELNVDEFEKLIGSSNNNNKNNQKEKVLVIDTRCAAEFVAGHVPNAVFGGTGTDQFDRFIGTIHSDHNVPVVFIHTPPFVATPYANAPIPAASSTVHVAAAAEVEEAVAANKAAIEEIAQRLVKAGLSNLRGHLKDGMAPWLEAGKPTVATERWTANTLVSKLLVDKNKIVVKRKFGQNQNDDESSSSIFHPQSLVDLREPCASDFSSLPNSESIPVSETVLKEVFHRAQHEKDRNHPLVLYCSNGFRSLMVTSALQALKPDINVVCMENGFDDLENVAEIKTLMRL